MDKLINYLKDTLHLSDEVVKTVLDNIKVKYVVPTYYYNDLLFTDLNVLNDPKDKNFYNLAEFNDPEFSTIVYKIVNDKGKDLIPKKGIFSHLKVGEEYWAIYKNLPPINVIVSSIEETASWAWYIYNYIIFIDKVNNKTFSFWDEEKDDTELYLFSTREEAVMFYKNKFNLN